MSRPEQHACIAPIARLGSILLILLFPNKDGDVVLAWRLQALLDPQSKVADHDPYMTVGELQAEDQACDADAIQMPILISDDDDDDDDDRMRQKQQQRGAVEHTYQRMTRVASTGKKTRMMQRSSATKLHISMPKSMPSIGGISVTGKMLRTQMRIHTNKRGGESKPRSMTAASTSTTQSV